jgi:hypothetical protein
MHPELEKIKAAADGLLFMSESDYPFELIELSNNSSIESQLLQLSGKDASTAIEKQTLEYFFRNSVTSYPTDDAVQKQTIQRFQNLKNIIEQTLKDIEVYRIGSVQIDAFIIGQLSDGTYGGLKTKLIET